MPQSHDGVDSVKPSRERQAYVDRQEQMETTHHPGHAEEVSLVDAMEDTERQLSSDEKRSAFEVPTPLLSLFQELMASAWKKKERRTWEIGDPRRETGKPR